VGGFLVSYASCISVTKGIDLSPQIPYICCVVHSRPNGELYYAPIYADDTVNLAEFAPVDMESADMDEMELFDIRNRLVEMCQV